MLSITNLTVSYSKDKQVLKNLSLNLAEHKVHGLVGLNGSGKTTLLNSIYGLLPPVCGTITYRNQKLTKKEIAFLETENFFYSNISGAEYLYLFRNAEFNVNQWNKLFELPLDIMVDNYSTGMKKKLALMGILKLNKPVLILDEPFNGLDLETCRIVQLIIQQLKEHGKTILITSHILESLTTICDSIHYLFDGNILFSKQSNDFHNLEKEIFGTFQKGNLIKELLNN